MPLHSRKRQHWPTICGILFLVVSGPRSIQIGRELLTGRKAAQQYGLSSQRTPPVTNYEGQRIEIIRSQETEYKYVLQVDDTMHSIDVLESLGRSTLCRTNMLVLENRETNRNALVVAFGWPNGNEKHFALIHVSADGSIKSEAFSFEDRSDPLYRTRVIAFVSSKPVGFYSDALTAWPSVIYPILYPGGTFVVGVILLIVGVTKGRIKAVNTH